jgi:hypothetical protein
VTLAMRFFDERASERVGPGLSSDFLERSRVESGRPWCSSSGVLLVFSVLEFLVDHPCLLLKILDSAVGGYLRSSFVSKELGSGTW